MNTVVVGAGEAGIHFSLALRDCGFEGQITVFGDEGYPPYQRPPLSKEYLRGQTDAEDLWLRDDELYANSGIEIRRDRIVDVRLLEDNDHRGEVHAESGATTKFSYLAIAQGGRPRRLSVPPSLTDRVHYLHSISDAALLREALAIPGRRLGVVGGGYIGLEVAATAADLGHQVTVVEREERLLNRGASPPLARFVLDTQRARGVRVLCGQQKMLLDEGTDGEVLMTLDGGEVLPMDLVVVGIGIDIDPTLAEACGLEFSNGIVTDDCGRTSAQGIFAIGDCSSQRYGAEGRLWRIESVHNATEQPRRAAAALMSRATGAASTPWFWSTQGAHKLQMVGAWNDADLTIVRGDMNDSAFGLLHFVGQRLAGGEFVNRPQDFLAVRRIIDSGLTVAPEEAADPTNRLSKVAYPLD